MKFTGTIIASMPMRKGMGKNGKEWRSQDYVLRYDNENPQYPKDIVFSVMGDNIEKFQITQGYGYELEVDFSAREYNGKWYMSANAWKCTCTSTPNIQRVAPQSAPSVGQMYQQAAAQYAQRVAPPAPTNDLPF